MHNCVVFNDSSSLDFSDIRYNVVRIPEVMLRLKEAQDIWDQVDDSSKVNFYQFLMEDDIHFMGNMRLKSLVSTVVQIGLFDRYLKQNKKPEYFVGNCSGNSALLVGLGLKSMKDMVFESKALQSPNRPLISIPLTTPILSGVSLTEYAVYKLNDQQQVEELKLSARSISEICVSLYEDHSVKKFINIGPGQPLFDQHVKDMSLTDVQILESINLDPLLSWFWPSIQRGAEPRTLANPA